jgi:hypothetical protein
VASAGPTISFEEVIEALADFLPTADVAGESSEAPIDASDA